MKAFLRERYVSRAMLPYRFNSGRWRHLPVISLISKQEDASKKNLAIGLCLAASTLAADVSNQASAVDSPMPNWGLS